MKALKYLALMMLSVIASLASAQERDLSPIPIENYDADLPILLDTLEAQGIIPSGAEEAFVQGNSVFGGDGSQFSTFALENDASNVLMGMTFTFSPVADTLEFCGIALRAQRAEQNQINDDSGNTVTTIRLEQYLAVGVDNAGVTFAVERGETVDSVLALADEAVALDDTIYLLALILNDELTVFANGNAQLTEYAVTLDAGAFAFLYAGENQATQCATDAIFAYTFDDASVDVCRISSNRPVNQRQSPSTSSAIITQLQPDAPLEATGQILGADGFTWWLLSDASWVRDDVISTSGFCRPLPEITDDES